MELIRYPNKIILAILHLIFWIAYFFLAVEANSFSQSYSDALLLAASLLLPQIILAYMNVGILIPWLFVQKKYIQYFLAILLLLLVILFLNRLRFEYIVVRLIEMPGPFRPGNPRHPPMPGARPPQEPLLFSFRDIMRGINGLGGIFSIYLISTVYSLGKIAFEREREAAILKNENLKAELNYLKSQINPHFLFNVLNNIYALSILRSDKTPGKILELSDILRYNIYDGNREKVPLKKEIEYINSYINLHKLKDEKIERIEFDYSEADPDIKLAPLLFIPFVENSFKHGKIEDTDNGWIRINLSIKDNTLFFNIMNSVPKGEKKANARGIGLENVRRRLELLYPERHELKIKAGLEQFEVNLYIIL